jgi:hypothetical protein
MAGFGVATKAKFFELRALRLLDEVFLDSGSARSTLFDFLIAEPLPPDGGGQRYVVAYYTFFTYNKAAARVVDKALLENKEAAIIDENLAYQNRSLPPGRLSVDAGMEVRDFKSEHAHVTVPGKHRGDVQRVQLSIHARRIWNLEFPMRATGGQGLDIRRSGAINLRDSHFLRGSPWSFPGLSRHVSQHAS